MIDTSSSQCHSTEQFIHCVPLPSEIRHIPIKRIFDIIFSVAVLILGLPLYLFIGILVRCTSKGPILYSQERVGRGGTRFQCWKFRTMYPNAEERLQSLFFHDPEKQNEWKKTYKLKNDPRITYVGHFLRKSSLDELPQFWNVLKGDLSVVGPRAVIQEEIIYHYGPKAHKILSIRPGLTGIWQVSGRNNLCYAKRIALDELYIDTRSFALDMKIIAKTIPCMLNAKGAY